MIVKMMSNQKTNDIYTDNLILSELITGIVMFGLLFQIVLIPSAIYWLEGSVVYYSLGLWIGIVVASLLAIHMNRSINKALDFSEADAVKMVRKDSIIRYIVLLIIFGIMMVTNVVSPLVAFIGVMGLKVGAYLQPLTHKILRKCGPHNIREYIREDDTKRAKMLEEYYEEQKRLEEEKQEENSLKSN